MVVFDFMQINLDQGVDGNATAYASVANSCVLAYWYMYGGCKSISGDVIFCAQNYKVEDVECVGKALRMKSINCVIKRKGKQFQMR